MQIFDFDCTLCASVYGIPVNWYVRMCLNIEIAISVIYIRYEFHSRNTVRNHSFVRARVAQDCYSLSLLSFCEQGQWLSLAQLTSNHRFQFFEISAPESISFFLLVNVHHWTVIFFYLSDDVSNFSPYCLCLWFLYRRLKCLSCQLESYHNLCGIIHISLIDISFGIVKL